MANIYGKSIVDGVPRFTSASSLTTSDANSFGGCLRKWWIEKILRMKQEETEAMRRGTHLLHKPIENFYETRVESFPPLAMSVRKYMYEPGDDLFIESEIALPFGVKNTATEENPMTDATLAAAPVKANGIPLVGRIDLTHGRGYYIDSNGELQKEPHKNTVEVNDWKSTSDENYAKSAAQLREAVQMNVYGKAVIVDDADVDWIRYSHTYALTKGSPRGFKRTVLVPRDEVERRWEYIDGLGRLMRQAAAEINIENVPANRKSCNAWGRKGCDFKHPQPNGGPPLCSAGRFNSLASLFGDAGAAHLLAQQDEPNNTEIIPTMSIMKRVNGETPAAAPTLPGPTVTAVNTPAAVGVQLTLGAQPTPTTLSMLDALEAEEAAATAPAPVSTLTQQDVDAISVIMVSDMGYPKTTGEAASLLAQYGALSNPPRTFSADGGGRLSGLNVHATRAELLKLAEDLKAHAAKKLATQPKPAPTPAPAPVVAAAPAAVVVMPTMPAPVGVQTISILPAETPASNPALAALPVDGLAPPPAVVVQPQPTPIMTVVVPNPVTQTTAVLPNTNPAPSPLANATGGATADTKPADKPAEQPKPPKAERKPREPKPPKTDKAERDSAADTVAPFELYIDCIPSKPYESLDAYIAQWCSSIVGLLQNKETDFPDIRTLSDKRADFGKWPGVLASLVRECVLEGKFPRGVYVVHTKGSPINTTVAEAITMSRHEDGTTALDFYVKGF